MMAMLISIFRRSAHLLWLVAGPVLSPLRRDPCDRPGYYERRSRTMTHIMSMIETHPNTTDGLDVQKLADCIEACFQCAQTCTACADACLAEEKVADLRNCIRLNLDCADLCATTGNILSRRTGSNIATVKAGLETCRTACADAPSVCDKPAGF